MKKLFLTSLLSLIFWTLYSQKLNIAVAANAQYVLKELVAEYKKHSNIQIDLVAGSSGKLTTQIIQGAPYNIFFSADLDYPEELFKRGFSDGSFRIYGYGSLVIWTIKDLSLSKNLKILKSSNIKKIAVANPEFAPYGTETIKVLKEIELYEAIKSKIVLGESLSQVNHYVSTGNCDVGFTAKSIVLASELKSKGKWIEIDTSLYDPIAQGVVILKNKDEDVTEQAKKFVDFVFSTKGKDILKRNGYLLKEI